MPYLLVNLLVSLQSSLDLVTIGQAMQWFNLHKVRQILKKPNRVIAAHGAIHHTPQVNKALDSIMERVYGNPYWDSELKMEDDVYKHIDLLFKPVEGEEHTEPFVCAAYISG
ncbi:hypothetical protein SLEP1_g49202 [Rubroshorea leprosula]|uniref:Uncharacterized protein n=1 Tax=Rubroshorea leprosula TaxID=152421 RepID=A0AAV5LW32_9ROSI|nr:hypothetical protein SLEP1_g49202 [Rubroshorea leprosula]